MEGRAVEGGGDRWRWKGGYSIILIHGWSAACFLAAQWPDSFYARVRVFPEKQRGSEFNGLREWLRRRKYSRHVIPVTVILPRYYSTANVINLWFNERTLDRNRKGDASSVIKWRKCNFRFFPLPIIVVRLLFLKDLISLLHPLIIIHMSTIQ